MRKVEFYLFPIFKLHPPFKVTPVYGIDIFSEKGHLDLIFILEKENPKN